MIKREAKTILSSGKLLQVYKKSYSLDQRILFLKQLHLILESGIPLLRGLELLEKRIDKQLTIICRLLIINLQSGKLLSEAMQKKKSFFSPLVIALIKAGEESGQLNAILASLIQYYNHQKELKSFFLKSLIYPCCLITAAFGVLLFFLLYVLPVLATTYTALQAKPTESLCLILSVSEFIKSWYPFIIMGLMILVSSIYSSFDKIASLFLHIDYFRKIYLLHIEARFCKLMALLLDSGININNAVIIAASTINDKKLLPKLQLFNIHLQKGLDISIAIKHSLGLFTPLTEELLTMGALTGYLPQMLEEAAKIAEDDFRTKIEKARELLTPILLLFATVLTAGIICTVMAPLFDLFTAIPEY